MVDSPRDPATRDAHGTPGWVKAFGIAAIVAGLLIVVVLLFFRGEHGPGLHTTPGAAGTQSPTTASQPATIAGVGAPAEPAEAARTVSVTTLDTMTFDPSSINVSAGETVRFVVTNTGQAAHEFTLGDAAMQQEHAAAMAHIPEGITHALPNSVTLQPGETAELTWRFGDARTLEYACHEPGHYDAGMRGQLTVD